MLLIIEYWIHWKLLIPVYRINKPNISHRLLYTFVSSGLLLFFSLPFTTFTKLFTHNTSFRSFSSVILILFLRQYSNFLSNLIETTAYATKQHLNKIFNNKIPNTLTRWLYPLKLFHIRLLQIFLLQIRFTTNTFYPRQLRNLWNFDFLLAISEQRALSVYVRRSSLADSSFSNEVRNLVRKLVRFLIAPTLLFFDTWQTNSLYWRNSLNSKRSCIPRDRLHRDHGRIPSTKCHCLTFYLDSRLNNRICHQATFRIRCYRDFYRVC